MKRRFCFDFHFFFTVVQHELTINSDYKITNQISFSSYIILWRPLTQDKYYIKINRLKTLLNKKK